MRNIHIPFLSLLLVGVGLLIANSASLFISLRHPDIYSEKTVFEKRSWIPSLVFNLILAGVAIISIPLQLDKQSALEQKIEIVNDKYKIDEHIINGLFALKKYY